MLAQRLQSRADADCGDHLHGKEGVDGSSPSEGLHKSLANRHFVLPVMARLRVFAGTRRVHFGASGHSRSRPTSRGTRGLLAILDREHP